MEQFVLPQICAKCGIQPGTNKYTIKIEKATLWDMLLFLVLALGHTVYLRYNKYAFDVLVCASCDQKLRSVQARNKIATSIGIIMMFMALFGIMGFAAVGLEALIHNLGLIGLLFIVGLLACSIFPVFNRIRIGSYNGRYFTFANPAFQSQFAKLNPHLVRSNAK